jgi:tetratricopeptide (TPR) repeat protein
MKLPSLLFLTLIAMGVYWNTLPNQFVAGDRQFILRNPHIGSFDTVKKAFTSDYWEKLGGESFIYYRPLTIFSHFIDFTLYGLNPGGHHFSNMIFHTIVTLMVFQLFLYLCAPRLLIPLIGASLFALHPIHTHSVSYVMGRTDILAALFFLGGLILLVRATGHQARPYPLLKIAGACVCYFLALLCKEMAVTLPLVFMLYWFCWSPEETSWKDARFTASCLSLCVTLVLYLMLRVLAVGLIPSAETIPSWYALWQRACLVVITCGYYLQKLFLPLRLCYYSNLSVPGNWQEVVQSSCFWTGMLWILSFSLSLKRAPRLSFALGWMGVTLLPVLNIVLIPTLAKENFLYIPSIGFCLLLCLVMQSLAHEAQATPRRVLGVTITVSVLLGIVYAGATLQRNTEYREPVTFLENTLKNMKPVAPHLRENVCYFEGVKNFYLTYKNLGTLYQERGQEGASVQAFENALHFTPSYFSPQYAATVKVQLGGTYAKMGRLDEAVNLLLEARPAAPRPERVDNLLGVIHVTLRKKETAARYFKRALRENENYAAAHHNLGILYLESDRARKGREELMEAARLNPQYRKTLAWYGLSSYAQ